MTGLFISLEGVDGVGKTTQTRRLRDYASGLGHEVVVTQEPGGTELGASLRTLLLHGGSVSQRAEALLFAADRAQHVEAIVRPALQRGAVVITDRYLDSSLAYQAGGRGLKAGEIRELSMWAVDGLLPARTYLLDMDPAQSHSRLARSEDRMESAGNGFQARTRQAFLALAHDDPHRFLVVDASLPIDAVWERIQADFAALLTDVAQAG